MDANTRKFPNVTMITTTTFFQSTAQTLSFTLWRNASGVGWSLSDWSWTWRGCSSIISSEGTWSATQLHYERAEGIAHWRPLPILSSTCMQEDLYQPRLSSTCMHARSLSAVTISGLEWVEHCICLLNRHGPGPVSCSGDGYLTSSCLSTVSVGVKTVWWEC